MENNLEKELSLPAYAHLGDAVWEIFVREIVVNEVCKISKIHQMTTKYVCAGFQEKMLFLLDEHLSEEEKEIARRGRNISLTKQKLKNPTTHRHATAFEVLIGYWYKNDKDRLNEIFSLLKNEIKV